MHPRRPTYRELEAIEHAGKPDLAEVADRIQADPEYREGRGRARKLRLLKRARITVEEFRECWNRLRNKRRIAKQTGLRVWEVDELAHALRRSGVGLDDLRRTAVKDLEPERVLAVWNRSVTAIQAAGSLRVDVKALRQFVDRLRRERWPFKQMPRGWSARRRRAAGVKRKAKSTPTATPLPQRGTKPPTGGDTKRHKERRDEHREE